MATSIKQLEYEELKEKLVYEIMQATAKDYDNCPALQEIQPVDDVMALAVEAAVNVLLAFERGYRMGE